MVLSLKRLIDQVQRIFQKRQASWTRKALDLERESPSLEGGRTFSLSD